MDQVVDIIFKGLFFYEDIYLYIIYKLNERTFSCLERFNTNKLLSLLYIFIINETIFIVNYTLKRIIIPKII